MGFYLGQGCREAAPALVKLQFTEQALDDLIRPRAFIAEKNPAVA